MKHFKIVLSLLFLALIIGTNQGYAQTGEQKQSDVALPNSDRRVHSTPESKPTARSSSASNSNPRPNSTPEPRPTPRSTPAPKPTSGAKTSRQ